MIRARVLNAIIFFIVFSFFTLSVKRYGVLVNERVALDAY